MSDLSRHSRLRFTETDGCLADSLLFHHRSEVPQVPKLDIVNCSHVILHGVQTDRVDFIFDVALGELRFSELANAFRDSANNRARFATPMNERDRNAYSKPLDGHHGDTLHVPGERLSMN